jgi:hypothetical protein
MNRSEFEEWYCTLSDQGIFEILKEHYVDETKE